MLLLFIAIVFMFTAVAAMCIAFAATSTVALLVALACVAAAALCVRCEDVLYKRSLQRKRIAAKDHTRSYHWM